MTKKIRKWEPEDFELEMTSFTAYTENLFNDEEQIELARFVDDLHRKGGR